MVKDGGEKHFVREGGTCHITEGGGQEERNGGGKGSKRKRRKGKMKEHRKIWMMGRKEFVVECEEDKNGEETIRLRKIIATWKEYRKRE